VSREKTPVFLVDDHPLVREWLTALINKQPDLVVCGEVEAASRASIGSPSKFDVDSAQQGTSSSMLRTSLCGAGRLF